MKPPIKNFDPYTGPNGLHSLRSLRKFARRIKTRVLRTAQIGCAVSALAMIWSLGACEDDDEARTVVQRHDTVDTGPVDASRVYRGIDPNEGLS